MHVVVAVKVKINIVETDFTDVFSISSIIIIDYFENFEIKTKTMLARALWNPTYLRIYYTSFARLFVKTTLEMKRHHF